MFVPSFAYFIYSCSISGTVFINSIKHIYICCCRWGNSISLKGVVNVLDFFFDLHLYLTNIAHPTLCQLWQGQHIYFSCHHCAKKPVSTMLTYPWKCTVLHCNHLGNTWKPLVLMTRHFDYCPSASMVLTGFFAQCLSVTA